MLPHDIQELLNLFNTKNEQKDKMNSTAELLFTYMKTKIEEAPRGGDHNINPPCELRELLLDGQTADQGDDL